MCNCRVHSNMVRAVTKARCGDMCSSGVCGDNGIARWRMQQVRATAGWQMQGAGGMVRSACSGQGACSGACTAAKGTGRWSSVIENHM